MNFKKRGHWMISIISFIVFILTFFILFRETGELSSSLFAAIFSGLLAVGTLFTMVWLTRVFTKL